jgi:DNA polymerase III gamma/tau subunit
MSLFPDSQPGFAFPQPLCEKYRPRTIEGFIGLEKQRKILAAFSRRPVSCAWLFIGPSGTGKSTIAKALFDTIGAEQHIIPSQRANIASLDEVVRMCWYHPLNGQFHGVQCDEVDQCTPAFQLAMLSKLDSVDPVPNTVWIFTANDSERLEKRFLSRCRVLEFSTYGMRSDLAGLLADVWQKETGKAGELDFERIAKNANNNVREALSVLELELLAQ